MKHPDRPAWQRQTVRPWRVLLQDGTELVIQVRHRAEARHYSRSMREDYVSSFDHYRDVKSVRLIRGGWSEDIPF